MNNSHDEQETGKFSDSAEGNEHWQKVKSLFNAASELPGKERGKFLEKACGDDADLRGKVEKLLAIG